MKPAATGRSQQGHTELHKKTLSFCERWAGHLESALRKQESPAVADKPARRLRKVRTVYIRAVGL